MKTATQTTTDLNQGAKTMNIQNATAEVLEAAGWDQLASDVRDGSVDAQRAVSFALTMPGHFKAELEKAQGLLASL